MKYFIAFILILTVKIAFSQDTIRYRQKDAVLFGNMYYFYSNGEFEHLFQTDDMQTWYGKGTYSRFFNKYILHFGVVEPKKPQIKVIPKANNGLIMIKFFDLEQQNEEIYINNIEIKSGNDKDFNKLSLDMFLNNKTNNFNLSNKYFQGLTTIHIPKSAFSTEAFVNIDTKDIQIGGEIQIFLDIGKGGFTHYIEPKKEVLKKRGKYLKMPDRYNTVKEKNITLVRY